MTDPASFTVARRIGQCAAAALEETSSGAPDRVCLVVPGEIADDECECGQLAVTVPRLYPSSNFPAPTIDDGRQAPCGIPYLGVDLSVSIMRCVPGPDSKGRPPGCPELEEAARVWHEDATAVRRGVGCCLQAMEAEGTIVAYVLGATDAAGPRGGCVGSLLRLTVALVHCLCPDHAES